MILDASNLSVGPVTSVPLPDGDVPYGLHSSFVPWSELKVESDMTTKSDAAPEVKVETPTAVEDEYPIPSPR